MAAIGRLLGMSPAPVAACRVLEVGCADGGNLAALAVTLPESQFTGFDLAAEAIASGREMLRTVGLANVRLAAADLLEWRPEGRQFDYIIAHGFYSWVPVNVRDRLFEVIAATLAPHGIAYVSYNVYPGCFLRKMMAGMMHLHADRLPDPWQRVAQSRELMKFLLAGQTGESYAGRILREEAGMVLSESDENIFHDDLAPINDPVWFREFAAHARRFSLAYLAESEFYSSSDHHLPEVVREVLGQMTAADREQYLDFLKCRRFRGSLLVRAGVSSTPEPRAEEIDRLLISSPLAAVSASPSLAPGAVEEFKDRRGIPLRVDHPLSKAALLHLAGQHPRALSFPSLVSEASAMAAPQPVTPDDVEALRNVMLRAYQAGLIDLGTHEPAWAPAPGECPMASPLVRYQVGRKHPFVSSLRHLAVNIDDELAAAMLPLLDGTRNAQKLTAELAARFPASDLRQQIDSRLQTAAQQALLSA